MLVLYSFLLQLYRHFFLILLPSFGFSIGLIIGIIYHAWVIFSLGSGVKSWIALKEVPPVELANQIIVDDEKKCPFCAEKIKKEAIICKHCGKDVYINHLKEKARELGLGEIEINQEDIE